MLQTFKKVLANSEPSTHGGKADMTFCGAHVAF
jgi:prepilin-type processing-associated H-X9-DG protein